MKKGIWNREQLEHKIPIEETCQEKKWEDINKIQSKGRNGHT